jgi:rare lipoprotein A
MLRPTLVALAVTLLAAPSVADRSDRVVYREIGEASWYGPGFHGQRTASGEVFDQNALTAAHPELPLGSEVDVTNLENGRTITVAINDRGPYVDGRKLDLSRAAAKRLDMLESGIALVRIEATAQQIEQAVGDPDEAAEVD